MQNAQRRNFGFGTWNNLFRDHEIYVRTSGHVRFLHISARLQRRAATLALCVLALWLAGTAALVAWQAWTSWKAGDVDARAAAVEHAEARVAAERQTVEGIAATLDQRQDDMEALFESHFGKAIPAQPLPKASEQPAASAPPQDGKQVARLKEIEGRQDQMLQSLTKVAESRISRAETALQAVGLRSNDRSAQGGPFIPFKGKDARSNAGSLDPALRRLSAILNRMEQLENLLLAVPTGLPTDRMELSSGFGYRADPFTSQRALHAGLDFRGAHGTPIRAAAPGRVSFAGVKSGYGNVMEIDHGHGLLTRYAHLSGFTAGVGQRVASGQQIGRMGSTGRSTGTHLHFEIRVNGIAVNPRRFLEANPHVLEIKADTRSKGITGGIANVAAG